MPHHNFYLDTRPSQAEASLMALPHLTPAPKIVFLLALILCASGAVSAPLALLAGILFGFTLEHPFPADSHHLAKTLLQLSVVALGFGMNLQQVLHAGSSGFLYTAVSITLTLALGLALGKLLTISTKSSFLITAGTAICGGSAIAALAPITEASEEQISVSMGTVFLLNSVALLAFPPIGHALHLTQNQFGLWSALAIHDTSSVVGAAARYGPQALIIGTTVKLARALWIVPLSLMTAAILRTRAHRTASSATPARVQLPWFILFFCIASVIATYLPRFTSTWSTLNHLGKVALVATLFVIGTGLNRRTLKQVGPRPLIQGIVLWIIAASASLYLIHRNVISI